MERKQTLIRWLRLVLTAALATSVGMAGRPVSRRIQSRNHCLSAGKGGWKHSVFTRQARTLE